MQKDAKLIAELQQENRYLRQELAKLKSLFWGKKSERFVADSPLQETLFFGEDVVMVQPPAKVKEEPKPKKTPEPGSSIPVRKPIPPHIPRVDIVIEPEGIDMIQAVKIGEDITEYLDYKPGRIFVKRTIRPKYRIIDQSGNVKIEVANLPSQPVPKCNVSAGMISLILVSKYIDHLPIYRQLKQFLRDGVDLAESTVNGWVQKHLKLLEPLYELVKQSIQRSIYVMADETPMPVLSADKPGSTYKGYYWVYYSPVDKTICFEYDRSRSAAAADSFLKNHKGYLQTDGYGAYDHFDKRAEITLVGCMAHARRKFKEASDQLQTAADDAMKMFGQLYSIEEQARKDELSYEDRLKLRQKESIPIMSKLHKWMMDQLQNSAVLPKSLLGKAITYTLNLWPRLNEFTKNGMLEIDNNLIENKIRPIALGRKNYLFSGSHQAAQRAAMMYSLFAMCSIAEVNPQEWLTDIFNKINDHPINKLHELLPHNWKENQSTEISIP